jgi:hypothetical protein
MRIVDVGTFLLPKRLSLPALMSHQQRGGFADALTREFAEFRVPGPLATDGLLLDFHRSTGARLMETMLFQGAVDIDGLGKVRLFISSLAIGFVVVSFDLPDGLVVDLETTGDRDIFKEHEAPVTEAVNPLVADWCDRVVRALPPACLLERPEGTMAASKLLWWHRVSQNPPRGAEFPVARAFGVVADLGDGARAHIGNGFTNLYGTGGHLDDTVEGLIVATEEWLIVDEAKRLLAGHLVELSNRRDEGLRGVDAQYGDLLQLTEEVTLRKLLLSEELRYLANARVNVRDAATTAWRMDEESAELDSQIAALRDLFALHRERITNDRDDRRNWLVSLLTVITFVQSILVWYDFLTQDDVTVSTDPRPPIAFAVLGLTMVLLAGAATWRSWARRQGRR